jgi:hypothetical protein
MDTKLEQRITLLENISNLFSINRLDDYGIIERMINHNQIKLVDYIIKYVDNDVLIINDMLHNAKDYSLINDLKRHTLEFVLSVDGRMIRHVLKQDEQLQMISVSGDNLPAYINQIKEPSVKVQLHCVCDDLNNITSIINPARETIKYYYMNFDNTDVDNNPRYHDPLGIVKLTDEDLTEIKLKWS